VQLAGHHLDLGRAVVVRDADQRQQPGVDRSYLLAVHVHGRGQDPAHDGAQEGLSRRR
jgi:hypothetical protein